MRPSLMWGLKGSDGIGTNPLTVVVYATEDDALGAGREFSGKMKAFVRPVKMWVAQFPSLMWRETTDEEKQQYQGAEFIVGV